MKKVTSAKSGFKEKTGKSRRQKAVVKPKSLGDQDGVAVGFKNLTLRQLRLFEAVGTQLNFSRAAEQMNISQPAVSIQMQNLENNLGLQLLVKQGKKISLSHAGQELMGQIRRILNQVHVAEEMLASYQEEAGASSGLLHVGVVPTAHYFVPKMLMAFAKEWPSVKFKLTVDRRQKILSMLQNHQVDLVIAGFPPSEADVEAHTFAQHPHCIVASLDHPLAQRENVQWEDLKDEPFVFREPESATRQFFEHLLQAQSLQVKVSMELSGNETIKQAVMAGMGISFLSAHTFQIELEAGRMAVLQLDGMPKMLDWCVLHRRDTNLRGVKRHFKDFILANGASLASCRYGPALVA
jgi:DNA-binding transcriptional LysR family regulator